MSVSTVRQSRKNHGTGKIKVAQVDHSGIRGLGTRDGSVLRTLDTPHDPGNKTRPFKTTRGAFEWHTPAPTAMEDVNHGKEGPPRSNNTRKRH